MAIIDPTRTWVPVEDRLAVTTNERHRQVLGVVLEHMKAEAEPDMDRLMATLSPNPDYPFWYANADMGPKTTEGVRAYYEAFVASGANHLVFEIDRLAVDDDLVMTEGWMKMIYPGAAAQGIGYALSEEMETEGGVLHSTLFANYLIPTALDLPDLTAIGLELYLGKGPFGARGIGEPPIGPCGPALASAVQDAVGVRMHRLPMTPERVLAALHTGRDDSVPGVTREDT